MQLHDTPLWLTRTARQVMHNPKLSRQLPGYLCFEQNRARLLGVQMDLLTAFGLFAVIAMLVCYALETRGSWFILAFAGACVMGSMYGFLQGAWPFGLVEAVWSLVALRRWLSARDQGYGRCHATTPSAEQI
jgi:hypothetical protein